MFVPAVAESFCLLEWCALFLFADGIKAIPALPLNGYFPLFCIISTSESPVIPTPLLFALGDEGSSPVLTRLKGYVLFRPPCPRASWRALLVLVFLTFLCLLLNKKLCCLPGRPPCPPSALLLRFFMLMSLYWLLLPLWLLVSRAMEYWEWCTIPKGGWLVWFCIVLLLCDGKNL